MFVRVCVVLLLSIGILGCKKSYLLLDHYGPPIAIEAIGKAFHVNKNYDCSDTHSSRDICERDAKDLSVAAKARVCGSRMSNCRHDPIQQTAGMKRICYSTDGKTGFCWFEDPNT